MRTLYESIIQSREPSFKIGESILSKSGVGKIYQIQSWLDEHEVKNYTINSKEEIDVDGDVDLRRKGLTEFPSFIQFGIVKGFFDCSFNNLTSLRGCPRVVKKSFYCYSNKLESLEGSPEEVGGSLYCYCNNLTTLKGSPKVVKEDFDCSHNKLKTLEGSPEKVGGRFNCKDNVTNFTKADVKKVCKVGSIIYA